MWYAEGVKCVRMEGESQYARNVLDPVSVAMEEGRLVAKTALDLQSALISR